MCFAAINCIYVYLYVCVFLYVCIYMYMEEAKEGVKIAGRTLNNLRYADETTLMAGKKADLKNLKRESRKAGLYFNIKKTKIMTTANGD